MHRPKQSWGYHNKQRKKKMGEAVTYEKQEERFWAHFWGKDSYTVYFGAGGVGEWRSYWDHKRKCRLIACHKVHL